MLAKPKILHLHQVLAVKLYWSILYLPKYHNYITIVFVILTDTGTAALYSLVFLVSLKQFVLYVWCGEGGLFCWSQIIPESRYPLLYSVKPNCDSRTSNRISYCFQNAWYWWQWACGQEGISEGMACLFTHDLFDTVFSYSNWKVQMLFKTFFFFFVNAFIYKKICRTKKVVDLDLYTMECK